MYIHLNPFCLLIFTTDRPSADFIMILDKWFLQQEIKICQNQLHNQHLDRINSQLFCNAICPLLLSNSCYLSSNLFNETFILEKCDTYPTLHSEFILLRFEIHEDLNKQNANLDLNNGSEATWKIDFKTYTNDFFSL